MDLIVVLANGLREAFGPTAAWFALMAIGLNVHYGYTGLLNFGVIGFALVGGYGTAIGVATFGWSLWVSVLFGLALGVLLSLLLGIPTLRLRADYFAIVTIAAAEVLRLVVRSNSVADVTGGPFGLQGIAGEFYTFSPVDSGFGVFSVWAYRADQVWVTGVTWALVLICAFIVFLLMRSPWGRAIRAVREDEDAARSLGKNAFALKLQALVLGGAFASLGGVMLTIQNSAVTDLQFLPRQTFFVWVIVLLGGAATTYGPIVGSMLFWFMFSGFTSLLRQLSDNGLLPFGTEKIGGMTFLLVGLVLVLLIVYRPQGMFGNRQELVLGTAR